MKRSAFFLGIDILNVVLPALIVTAWLIMSAMLDVPEYIMPSPKQIFVQMADFILGSYKLTPYSGGFWIHSLASIGRVVGGFAIATLLGLPLGILTGHFSNMHRLFDPLVHILRMVPGIGWLPIAMVWFGVGNSTTIFLISLAAFFPVYLNTAQGVRHVPEKVIQAGRMLGADGYVLFTTIIVPAAMPSILAGMRLGLGVCWAYLVLGELTGVSKGLGAVMMDSRMLGNVDIIIICMISIAFWGKITDKALLLLMRRFQLHREVVKNG